MNDVTLDALQASLRGLSVRQRVIADNVANVETPGFQASRVDFESVLKAALEGGESPMRAEAIELPTDDPMSPNSSNVNIDNETVAMIDTGLRYQLMVNALNNKFAVLRSSIGPGL